MGYQDKNIDKFGNIEGASKGNDDFFKIPDVLGVGKVTLAIMTDQRDDLIRD